MINKKSGAPLTLSLHFPSCPDNMEAHMVEALSPSKKNLERLRGERRVQAIQ